MEEKSIPSTQSSTATNDRNGEILGKASSNATLQEAAQVPAMITQDESSGVKRRFENADDPVPEPSMKKMMALQAEKTVNGSASPASCDEPAEEIVVTLEQGIAKAIQGLDEEETDDDHVAAVLGDCSMDVCSYDKGYVKRQALYSCTTCYDGSKEVAGICLACTYACHDGHDLVELYTKRNFRCDCGNSKFSGMACKLTPFKDIVNEQNQYNQNFLNAYCICNRPYPDPNTSEDKELVQVQCTFCEDWFHLDHVLKDTGNIEERLKLFRSLICSSCLKKHAFVNFYVAMELDDELTFDPEVHTVDGCAFKFLQERFKVFPPVDGAAWESIDWYEVVCRCGACKAMYEKERVEFLLDSDESVSAYEEKGREKALLEQAEEASNGESALQELLARLESRFAQNEFAAAFADMKRNMHEAFREISERGEVITEQHITEFFDRERERRAREREENFGGGSSSGN